MRGVDVMKCCYTVFAAILLICLCGCHADPQKMINSLDLAQSAQIKYDEMCNVCDIEFNNSDDFTGALKKIAKEHPDILKFRISQNSDFPLDIDFAEFQAMRNVACVDIHARCKIRNLAGFLRNRQLRNMSVRVSQYENRIHMHNGSRMPEEAAASEEDCIVDPHDTSMLYTDEVHDIFVVGDSFRFANFSNDNGKVPVKIKKFPKSCNAVGLSGNFELLPSCEGDIVEYLVLDSDGSNLQALINEITPQRFPALRFLRLFVNAANICEIDVSGLAKMKDIKVFGLYLRNVIPIGLADLSDCDEARVVKIGIELRRPGATENLYLLMRPPNELIPEGCKLAPGTMQWDVDGFPIWYEDYLRFEELDPIDTSTPSEARQN